MTTAVGGETVLRGTRVPVRSIVIAAREYGGNLARIGHELSIDAALKRATELSCVLIAHNAERFKVLHAAHCSKAALTVASFAYPKRVHSAALSCEPP